MMFGRRGYVFCGYTKLGKSLLSVPIRSGQQILNNSLNFAFLIDIIAQLRVIILFEQNVGARFCIKCVNVE